MQIFIPNCTEMESIKFFVNLYLVLCLSYFNGFITTHILYKMTNTVGVYRLSMKTNSDNFCHGSSQTIMKILLEKESVV